MDLLKVEHLSVDFVQGSKTFHAVRDVSLKIKKGKTLALVGESGSGKSSQSGYPEAIAVPSPASLTIPGRRKGSKSLALVLLKEEATP